MACDVELIDKERCRIASDTMDIEISRHKMPEKYTKTKQGLAPNVASTGQKSGIQSRGKEERNRHPMPDPEGSHEGRMGYIRKST